MFNEKWAARVHVLTVEFPSTFSYRDSKGHRCPAGCHRRPKQEMEERSVYHSFKEVSLTLQMHSSHSYYFLYKMQRKLNYINLGDLLLVPSRPQEHVCSLSVKEIRHPIAWDLLPGTKRCHRFLTSGSPWPIISALSLGSTGTSWLCLASWSQRERQLLNTLAKHLIKWATITEY